MMSRRAATLLLAALAVGAAGCGKDSEVVPGSPTTTTETPWTTVRTLRAADPDVEYTGVMRGAVTSDQVTTPLTVTTSLSLGADGRLAGTMVRASTTARCTLTMTESSREGDVVTFALVAQDLPGELCQAGHDTAVLTPGESIGRADVELPGRVNGYVYRGTLTRDPGATAIG